jgi:hypothetical protein
MSDKQAFFLFALLLLAPILALAQQLELPEKSPRARVTNTIGYTEITVDYGAPERNGRDIWGVVVPYNQLWRAGANKATTIQFSTDVSIESHPLEAGTYAFFVEPKEEGPWTIIFNKNPQQWGTAEYNSNEDILRIEVMPRFSRKGSEEALKYEVQRQNLENGYLLLSWEKLRLYVRIKVNTMDKAVNEIKETLKSATDESQWEIEARAADFLLWAGQPGVALPYAERSVSLQPTSWNYWIKAKVHAAMNAPQEAIAAGEQARELGKKSEADRYYESHQTEIDWLIEQWKKTD